MPASRNKMRSREKVYVEFFGLSGAGKTTILKALADKAAAGNLVITATDGFREFCRQGRLYRHIAPPLRDPLLTARLLGFVLKSRIRVGTIYKFFQSILVDHFIFSMLDFTHYLNDGLFHVIEDSLGNGEALLDLFDYYPGRELILVHVDTSEESVRRRVWARNGIALETAGLRSARDRNRRLFEFFRSQRGRGKISGVLRVDGDRPVEDNADILNREIFGQ